MNFLLFLLLCFSFCLHAYSNDNAYITKAHELNLSETTQWLKFLHYEKDFGIRSSEADGMNFFITKKGKKDPKAEMDAEILSLVNTKDYDDNSVLCRFPARSRWLKDTLKMDSVYFPYDKCKGYNDFINEHVGSNVYVVFSSYYLESPASAFGHTMIRLGKRDTETKNNVEFASNKQSELLDTGIGYAANSTTDNSLIYTFMGITGGFQGTYSSIPYFYKIREYNDYESRDLWSYELSLSDEQKLKFLEHLWELGHTYFDYFYFTQNCSYNLITLLDTVNPEWGLSSKIPFYVIPVDTLKAISSVPSLVTSVNFRPSVKRTFEHNFNKLSKDEKKKILISANDKDLSYIKLLPDSRKAIWTDSLIDYIDFKYAREVLLEKGPYYEWKKIVLAERSQQGLNKNANFIEMPMNERPESGHASTRMELGAGLVDGQQYSGKVKLRFAMHDLLDPTRGQPTLASLNFFELGLRYNFQNNIEHKSNQFQFNYLKIFEIATLNPWTEFNKPLSLLAETGTKRIEGCSDLEGAFECQSPYLEVGGGVTKANSLGSVSVFLQGNINYSGRFNNHITTLLGPKFIGLYRPCEDFVLAIKGLWQKEFMDHERVYTLGSEMRYYFSLNFGIKESSEYLSNSGTGILTNYWKHDISVLYYF